MNYELLRALHSMRLLLHISYCKLTFSGLKLMVQELDDTSLLDPDDDVVRVDGEDEVD